MNFDPIRLELYKNMLASVAEEMGVTLCRAAFSPNIKERRDFSCAVFDAEGGMVAQAAHIPVHLGSMPLSVLSAIEHSNMSPGDMVILNDPFRGGTHLPDITLVAPVFVESTSPAFFIANRAHHSDVGGMTPGSMPLSRSVIQEGIRIPPVKLIQGGELNTDLWDLILANVRTPVERRGDIEAQIAANQIGERGLIEITQKYGMAEVQEYMTHLQAYSRRMMCGMLREIPDGRYQFSDFLDNDGISDKPIEISVQITIKGDEAVVDFTGTSGQVQGSVNAIYGITLSAVFYVFRCLAGYDIPSNSGCLAPIRVIAPEGTIVNARFPAAVAGGNVETSQRIVDVLLGSLAKACPGRIPAASSGTMNNVTIGGYDPFRKRDFAYYETIGGGMGARPDRDGIDAIHTHMTNTMNTPIEAIETTYPMQVEQYAIRQNTGGKGKFCGGNGIVRSIRLLSEAQVTILSERRKLTPYGLNGGQPGKVGRNVLIRKDEKIELPGKTTFTARNGDIVQIETPGGGGYGN
ncbi:MAG: hydantoinase B/oxoprolinase family protein [Candidatus Poribacteria bacterium]